MRSEPQDTAQGPCWPRKPEFGGALGYAPRAFGAKAPSSPTDIFRKEARHAR